MSFLDFFCFFLLFLSRKGGGGDFGEFFLGFFLNFLGGGVFFNLKGLVVILLGFVGDSLGEFLGLFLSEELVDSFGLELVEDGFGEGEGVCVFCFFSLERLKIFF